MMLLFLVTYIGIVSGDLDALRRFASGGPAPPVKQRALVTNSGIKAVAAVPQTIPVVIKTFDNGAVNRNQNSAVPDSQRISGSVPTGARQISSFFGGSPQKINTRGNVHHGRVSQNSPNQQGIHSQSISDASIPSVPNARAVKKLPKVASLESQLGLVRLQKEGF